MKSDNIKKFFYMHTYFFKIKIAFIALEQFARQVTFLNICNKLLRYSFEYVETTVVEDTLLFFHEK